jgi:hypothetical protein
MAQEKNNPEDYEFSEEEERNEYAEKIQKLCNNFNDQYMTALRELDGENYFTMLISVLTISNLSLKFILSSIARDSSNRIDDSIIILLESLTKDIELQLCMNLTKIKSFVDNICEAEDCGMSGTNEMKH